MPALDHIKPSPWYRPLNWVQMSPKIIPTSMACVGILYTISWVFDLVLPTSFCNGSAEAGRSVRTAKKWRIAKESINLEKLQNIALEVRIANHKEARPQLDNPDVVSEVEDAYLSGSYNFFFKINFSDDTTWLARIAGYAGSWEDQEMRKHAQDHQTLDLLRQTTALPLHEVFFWETSIESMGRSFVLISYLPGIRLFERWFDDTWATEERRLKILTGIAEAMVQLGRLRFEEVGGLLFDPSTGPIKIGPTYEYRQMRGESPELSSYGPWRTYQHYQRDKEGRMSHESNTPERLYQKVILMASRSIPDFMYGDGTYLAHPDFNLQNILVNDEANVTGIIDWDDTWTRCRSTGYATFPTWLTQDWDPANYAWNAWSDSDLETLRPHQCHPGDLRRWRKHYSTVFSKKWTEHLKSGKCDSREHTHSHIIQAIDYAMVSKTSRPTIVEKLLDHAFRGKLPFDVDRFTVDGYENQQVADILVKIGQAFDEMWLCEPEY